MLVAKQFDCVPHDQRRSGRADLSGPFGELPVDEKTIDEKSYPALILVQFGLSETAIRGKKVCEMRKLVNVEPSQSRDRGSRFLRDGSPRFSGHRLYVKWPHRD
jgi:hypothetical protein